MFDLTCLTGKWKVVSRGFIYSTNIYWEHTIYWVLSCISSTWGALRKCGWMNEWMNGWEWPSHRCSSWMQLQRPLGHRRLSVPSSQLLPDLSAFHSHLGLQNPWLSPSLVSLLGFQPRGSDKEAVTRTHPLCITIVRCYKGCSKRRHLTCIWKVPSAFNPIKNLFCPV